VISSIGPLSTSLAGLSLFMRVVISAKPWLVEPALIPLPWNPRVTITSNTQLKIGIMAQDDVVLPHPPIARAISALSSKLSSIPNITVVPWHAHLHDEAWAILSSLYYPDGGAGDHDIMAETGEPWLPLTEWIIKDNPCVKTLTPHDLSYWLEEREEYRREYAAVWNKTATATTTIKRDESNAINIVTDDDDNDAADDTVDVILCPVGPGVATRHNTAKYWGYTAVWNLLDYPAVVFPVDKVNGEIDVAYPREDFMSGADEQAWKLCKFLHRNAQAPFTF
jgi:amidase